MTVHRINEDINNASITPFMDELEAVIWKYSHALSLAEVVGCLHLLSNQLERDSYDAEKLNEE